MARRCPCSMRYGIVSGAAVTTVPSGNLARSSGVRSMVAIADVLGVLGAELRALLLAAVMASPFLGVACVAATPRIWCCDQFLIWALPVGSRSAALRLRLRGVPCKASDCAS